MTDTRPLCPECEGKGRRLGRKCKPCFGSGRQPQIIEAGPIAIRAEAYARPQ